MSKGKLGGVDVRKAPRGCGRSPLVVIVHERRHRADLDRVRVVGGVLEETVIRVEELPGDQEEELSGGAAVVQPAAQDRDKCNTGKVRSCISEQNDKRQIKFQAEK